MAGVPPAIRTKAGRAAWDAIYGRGRGRVDPAVPVSGGCSVNEKKGGARTAHTVGRLALEEDSLDERHGI